MGCSQSKIDQEEAVARCRERKRLMGEAVAARNAFAAHHSAYAIALKSTGGALTDYAHGEAPDPNHLTRSPSAPPAAATGATNLPPPPPPLPPPLTDFSPAGLQRSVSMPDIPIPNSKNSRKPPADAPIREEDDGAEADDDDGHIADDGSSDADDADDADDDDDHHHHAHIDDSINASPVTPPPPPPRPKPSPPTPASTPPPPMPEPRSMGSMGTWDYFFGAVDTIPPPTLAKPDDETWSERREPEAPEMTKLPKPARDETVVAHGPEERPPATPLPPKPVVENPPPLKPVAKKPPKPPGPPVHQHAAIMASAESRKGKMVVAPGSANLLDIITQIDDHFLKASESAHDVSKQLEAIRMHYHSNHVDDRGHIDHSAKIMQVITWNRSFKGLPEQDDVKGNFEIDEKYETHATTLDKMLAWEKKLYDEVKAGELMKIEYQRKVSLLNKQKKHGVKPETLEKTKAAVSHLHTRYIVDMQSLDSTVSEINKLRDKQLYLKLVELVGGMAKMWEAMYGHHRNQYNIISGIRSFEISPVPRETSDFHLKQTSELRDIVREWHSQFGKVMSHQKEYIKALNGWLRLNLIPIESSLKEKVSSPPRQLDPPIKYLLHAWYDQLEKLPVELAKTVIKSFADVINNIVVLQEDEVRIRRRCEDTRRELERKRRQFDDWHRKYMERRAQIGEDTNPESGETANPDPVAERKVAVEEAEIRLKEEEENHWKISKQVREKSLGSLRMHLPELFRAMADFASFSSDMYKNLLSITQSADEVKG